MESSVLTGRPRVTIVNGTRSAIWVAIYKRSPLRTDEPPIAWQIVSPPPRGKTALFIPRELQVCARYSFEPENPWRPVHQTNVCRVPHAPAGAGFVIESVPSQDRRTWGAVLNRAAENPGWSQIRVVNRFSIGVSIHLRMEERAIFPPRIVPPMAVLTEDLDSLFYVAVLPLPRAAGDLLPISEIALTEIAVKVGESVRVQGGPRRGFKISRVSAGDSTRDPEPDIKAIEQPKPAKKPASRRRTPRKTRKTPAK